MNKDYFKNYYRNNLKKFRPGIGIREIAIIKWCARITVYRNREKFDKIPNTKNRYYLNEKILDWYPNNKGQKNV